MKYLFSIGLLFASIVGLNAQPSIQWQRAFGGSDSDDAYAVQQTQDGGYVVAGSTVSIDGDIVGNHGGSEYWVIKLNANGQLNWKKTYGSTNNEGCYKIRQTSDGGYILAGFTSSNNGQVSGNHGDLDAWIVKIDSTGLIQWQKCYGGSFWEEAWSITGTTDGGYIFAGRTGSSDGEVTGYHGAFDFWVVKTDANGEIQWQKALGGSDIDLGYVVKQTSDGGYIIIGESLSNDGDVQGANGNGDYWVVKLNSSGEIAWTRMLGGPSLDRANDVWETSNGSFVVFGHITKNGGDISTYYGGYDWWLVKLDASGDLIWEKTYGGSKDDFSRSIYQTSDGGFIMAGSTNSKDGDVQDNDGGVDFLLIRVDSSGQILWQKTLGGTMGERAYSIAGTKDGGSIVAGFAWSNNGDVSGVHGVADYWIVKLAPETSSTQSPTAIPLNLYPNPATQWITLNLPIIEQHMQVNITDEQGRVLQTRSIRTDEKLDIAALPLGVYWVSAVSKSGQVYVGKFVKN
ncbi:MAG TPA: T9SS type A sorting domain-containing protein [Saprospiraceae bacterium]|nr:T9SS type A sorting domain-containing protein [Saprospiraceae bacterium]